MNFVPRKLFQSSNVVFGLYSKLITCQSYSSCGNKLLLNRFYCSAMASHLPNVVFVLGGPGAGKGTQCTRIQDEFGYIHLSAGDLLREERARPGSQFGALIENCIVNGTIVPVSVTCSLLENRMNQYIKEEGKYDFLIDGFPRNKDNLDGWESQMKGKANLRFVLFFDCPEEMCTNRCLKRGQAGSGRTDDNEESLRKRFNTYINDSLPIIKHYDTKNLVKRVDANQEPDVVFNKVKEIFAINRGEGGDK